VWYEPVRDSTGAVVGYRITGYGKNGTLLDLLYSEP
jgi:hypothetical protein